MELFDTAPSSMTEQSAQSQAEGASLPVGQGEEDRVVGSSNDTGGETREQIMYIAPKELAGSPFNDIVNPPTTQEAKDALEQSIREFGVLNPLIAWGNSGKAKPPVLAGNQRLSGALKVGTELVPVILRDFSSREEAKKFAIRENTERRELTLITRAVAADELWRLFDRAADKKASSAAGMPPRKRAALAAGVSEGTLAAFRYVKESGDEKLIAAMLADELPISAAHRQVKMQVEGTPATGKTSTGSAKADKTLADLKTAMSVIKNLPVLSGQIGEIIPKAAGRAKKADRERLVKLLTSAKAFIGTARKDDPLGALESAIKTAEAGIE